MPIEINEKIQVILPLEILEIFYKSSKINKLEWVLENQKYIIDRSLFKLNGQFISSLTKDFYLEREPNLALFFKVTTEEFFIPDLDFYEEILNTKTDVLIILKTLQKKTKYILKLNKLIEVLLNDGIITKEFYNQYKDVGLFCTIDDYCLHGMEQDIKSLLYLISQYYPLHEPIIIDLLKNNIYLDLFENVVKYIVGKKDFLTIAGNSGGGNVTAYWNSEQFKKYSHPTEALIPIMHSWKLNEKFNWDLEKIKRRGDYE